MEFATGQEAIDTSDVKSIIGTSGANFFAGMYSTYTIHLSAIEGHVVGIVANTKVPLYRVTCFTN